MKLNRKHLRKMILNEIKNLSEAIDYPTIHKLHTNQNIGAGGRPRLSVRSPHFRGGFSAYIESRQDQNVIITDQINGMAFSIEVPDNTAYGREAIKGDYSDPSIQMAIQQAMQVFPQIVRATY